VWFLESKSKKLPAKKNRSGVAVSERVLKNERLGSDFILGAIEDGVMMVSRDNLIQLFNPGASEISGWPAEEAVGLDFHNVLKLVNQRGETCPPEAHPFTKALVANSTVRDSKVLLSTKGGKTLPISVVVSPVLDENNHSTGNVVGVFRDVAKENAEEAQRSDFVSTASHEMRTPLAAIEGYLALATNPKIATMDDNARKYIDKAAAATKHLGELFQDLLTSSRAEDGRLASYPAVIEIGETLEQVVEAGRFKAKEKNLELHYIVSSDKEVAGGKVVRPLYYAYADPNRVREVLQNIVDNAIKYTPSGSITLRLTGDHTVVQMQVSDTGSGIPPEDIPHLFQKFYRVDSSLTRTVGGTGLGLFICRKIIELYNGRVWVESQLGSGSTFFINLPRLNAQQALEMQRRQSASFSPLDT
jgi:PAS domain S-box-containing protein